MNQPMLRPPGPPLRKASLRRAPSRGRATSAAKFQPLSRRRRRRRQRKRRRRRTRPAWCRRARLSATRSSCATPSPSWSETGAAVSPPRAAGDPHGHGETVHLGASPCCDWRRRPRPSRLARTVVEASRRRRRRWRKRSQRDKAKTKQGDLHALLPPCNCRTLNQAMAIPENGGVGAEGGERERK